VRAADAKETWSKNCAKCHGEDGAGKTKMGTKLGVKDYTDPKVQDSFKDADLEKAIKDGVKDGETVKMKGYGDTLSDSEVKALVAYVRGLKK
jgi:mono/diheme cytochrome c family protein